MRVVCPAQLAAAAAPRLSTAEVVWALEVASRLTTHTLHRSHWRQLLQAGILWPGTHNTHNTAAVVSIAAGGGAGAGAGRVSRMGPAQLQRLLRCMARKSWARGWPVWQRVYALVRAQVRALGAAAAAPVRAPAAAGRAVKSGAGGDVGAGAGGRSARAVAAGPGGQCRPVPNSRPSRQPRSPMAALRHALRLARPHAKSSVRLHTARCGVRLRLQTQHRPGVTLQ